MEYNDLFEIGNVQYTIAAGDKLNSDEKALVLKYPEYFTKEIINSINVVDKEGFSPTERDYMNQGMDVRFWRTYQPDTIKCIEL